MEQAPVTGPASRWSRWCAGQQRGRHRPGVRREDGQGLRRPGPAVGAGLRRRRLQRRHGRRRRGRGGQRAQGPPDPPAPPPRPHRGPQPRLPGGPGDIIVFLPPTSSPTPRSTSPCCWASSTRATTWSPAGARAAATASGSPAGSPTSPAGCCSASRSTTSTGSRRSAGGHRRPRPPLPVAPLHPGHGPPRGLPDRRGQGALPAPRGRPVQVRPRPAAGVGHRRRDPQVPAHLPAQADHLLRRPRLGPDRAGLLVWGYLGWLFLARPSAARSCWRRASPSCPAC